MRPGPEHIGTTGAAAGDALVYDADADEYGPAPVSPALTPLATVVNGEPGLVFGTDGRIVYTEVSS